ncbi:MAG: histidinol-phosphate transaminase [Spirochaetaceae bacterium]|jgi:histidinol-phosphate aminotransferase|nr:histidinol-phosphate transaminase [Spirochaetaceae bacterium]
MTASRVSGLSPYIPGEQPGKGTGKKYIKLNANENPWPPSPGTVEALRTADPELMSLYPDPDSGRLREAIAGMLNRYGGVLSGERTAGFPEITPEMLFCGNGSDEILSFIFYGFFEGPRPLVLPSLTYSFYPVYAGYYNIPLRRVPLRSDFTLDIEVMLNGDSCGMIFANPNAPTGIGISRDSIRDILDRWPRDRAVVIDEAYVDFGGETVLPLLGEYENLIVVRTFSKSMAFAGMRLGYAVASPGTIRTLVTVKNSFNHFPVDSICQRAAAAACGDSEYYRGTCGAIISERDRFSASLREAGWRVLPSQTNFVLAEHPRLSGAEVYRKLKEAGILVRHFDIPGISNFVRISIGTGDQMKKLLGAVNNLVLNGGGIPPQYE